MKDDERALLLLLASKRPRQNDLGFATTLATECLGMNEKRTEYILQKWTDKGWWNYGVSVRAGWFEQAGLDEAIKNVPPDERGEDAEAIKMQRDQ